MFVAEKEEREEGGGGGDLPDLLTKQHFPKHPNTATRRNKSKNNKPQKAGPPLIHGERYALIHTATLKALVLLPTAKCLLITINQVESNDIKI